MAARAIGSARLVIRFVSVPVKLYTLASANEVHFSMLHADCGSRLKQVLLCPKDGVFVEREHVAKGYEFPRDSWVRFTPEELEGLGSPREGEIALEHFVPSDDLDWTVTEKSFFLGPDAGGVRGYWLLADAMRRACVAGLGQRFTRTREELVLVRAVDRGLVLHHAYYGTEVRSFADVDVGEPPEISVAERRLADQLVRQLTKRSATVAELAAGYSDGYRERVLKAVERKAAGEEIAVPKKEARPLTIELVEGLRRSVARESNPGRLAKG